VSLDEVAAEVDQLEREGLLAAPRAVDDAPEAAEVEEEGSAGSVATPYGDAAAPGAPRRGAAGDH